jgi:hypothetical protein
VAPPLPPAKTATWAGVNLLKPPAGEIPWQADPDPAPAARAAPVWPIRLRWPENQTEQILFSSPQVGQVAVLSVVPSQKRGAPTQGRVEGYDLTTGKLLGGRPLFLLSADEKQPKVRGDFSPDGTRLLVQHPTDARRLDVWAIPGGKHEAAWMPCATDLEPGGKPRWFALLDGGRVLTLSELGRLTLWQLPECRAVYTVEGIRGAVALSPGGKYLVAHDGAAYLLLATADGAWRGRRLLPEGLSLAAAFMPDGETLIAHSSVVHKGVEQESVLTRWRVPNGKLENAIPVPFDPRDKDGRLVILSQRHVLAGTRVIDWKFLGAVCSYRDRLPRFLNRGGLPEGKCWVGAGGGSNALLTVRSLPDGEIGALLARTAAGQAELVLGRGTPIAVNVVGGGPPDFQQHATDILTKRVKQLHLVPMPNAGMKVTVQVNEKANGSFTLTNVDTKATVQVPITELTATVELADTNGNKIATGQPGTFRTRPPAPGAVVFGDQTAAARTEPYSRCALWLNEVTLPALVVRDGNRLRALPEMMSFNADGR